MNHEFVDISFADFVEQAKQKNEYLMLCKLRRSQIITDDRAIYELRYNFQNIDEEPDYTMGIAGYVMPKCHAYYKFCYLLKEYFLSGKFQYPMNAIYSPADKKFLVHPGLGRRVVWQDFGPTSEMFICFNTSGIDMPYRKKYESQEELKADFPNFNPVFLKQHNTIVPWIQFDDTAPGISGQADTMYKFAKKVQNFYKTTILEANFDLEQQFHYDKRIVTDPKRKLTVQINDVSRDLLRKVALLMPVASWYERNGISIRTEEL